MNRQPNEIPASLKNIDVKSILRRRGVYSKQTSYLELKEAAKPIAQRIVKGRKQPKKPKPVYQGKLTNDEVMAYGEKQIRLIEIVEIKFENKVRQFVDKVVHGFLSHMDIKKDYFVDNEEDFLQTAQLDFTPLLNNIATLAGQNAYDLINHKDVYMPLDYKKQIIDNVEKFTKSMLDTDRTKLVDMLDNGISQGQSMAEIRNNIEASFSEYNKMQATRVTTTEVSRASVQAQIDAYKQSDIVEGLQWVIFGADDECADYDGDIISLDANFYGIENEFQDGDPPLHPNCKCQVIPVLIDESKVYTPIDNKALRARVTELESQIDKRTKDYKQLKADMLEQKADDSAYIKALEKYLSVDDEQD